MSAGVPVGGTTVMPPAPKNSHTLLLIASLILVFTLLCGGYFVWTTGLWKSFIQTSVQEEPVPQQTDTSDIETDLQSVDFGADAEADALEAQF